MRFKTFLEAADDKAVAIKLAMSKLNKAGTPKKVNEVIKRILEKYYSAFQKDDEIRMADIIVDGLNMGYFLDLVATGGNDEYTPYTHPGSFNRNDINAVAQRIPNSTGMPIPPAAIKEILIDVFGEPKQTSLFGEAKQYFWIELFQDMGIPEKLIRITESLFKTLNKHGLSGTPMTICRLIGQDLGLGTIENKRWVSYDKHEPPTDKQIHLATEETAMFMYDNPSQKNIEQIRKIISREFIKPSLFD
jgi:hypothetical protein